MSITAMKLIRDAIERGDDLTVIGAKHILDQAIAEAEKQEPIYAHPDPDALHAAYIMGVQDGKKMREWVGLTLDEIALINQDYPNPQGFALAVQAKLKEKNMK